MPLQVSHHLTTTCPASDGISYLHAAYIAMTGPEVCFEGPVPSLWVHLDSTVKTRVEVSEYLSQGTRNRSGRKKQPGEGYLM